jgi:hypothetical protein
LSTFPHANDPVVTICDDALIEASAIIVNGQPTAIEVNNASHQDAVGFGVVAGVPYCLVDNGCQFLGNRGSRRSTLVDAHHYLRILRKESSTLV